MMFAAPPEQALEWSDEGVEGAFRFMKRLWKAVYQHVGSGPAPALDVAALDEAQRTLRRQVHETLAKVTTDVGRRRTFNTAIAAVMELMNALGKLSDSSPAARAVMQEALENIALLLSPIVPHICHALYAELKPGAIALDAAWPKADPAALEQDEIELVVQVNGKLRGQIRVPKAADKAAIETMALASPNVQKFIEGMAVKKVIVVPGRLVNIVAG
jgi:leucyl-tRNA synthetase